MQVQLTTSHKSIQAGQDCTFTVTASPGSTVLLMGFLEILTSEELESKFTTNENLKRNELESDLFMLENGEHDQCSHKKMGQVENRKPADSRIVDSWFFETLKIEEEETVEVSKSAPEKIGTWTVAAAVFHPKYAATFSKILSIKVKTNISMQIIMPPSTRYREPTKIVVLVFNFMAVAEKVQVTLSKGDNYDDFEFIDCDMHSNDGFMKTQELEVAANSVASAAFYIRPMKPKSLEINLKVEPENAEAMETEETLFVDPEGVTKYEVTTQLVDLRLSRKSSSYLQLSEIFQPILNSVKIEASIETDLIKTALLDARKLM